jgi:hypothetical protein
MTARLLVRSVKLFALGMFLNFGASWGMPPPPPPPPLPRAHGMIFTRSRVEQLITRGRACACLCLQCPAGGNDVADFRIPGVLQYFAVAGFVVGLIDIFVPRFTFRCHGHDDTLMAGHAAEGYEYSSIGIQSIPVRNSGRTVNSSSRCALTVRAM